MSNMQVNYPKMSQVIWDPVHITYPVRKFPETSESSETLARQWRNVPEVLKRMNTTQEEIKEFNTDHNVTVDLKRSQTSVDYTWKPLETTKFYKHSPFTENHYIYPPSKKLADRPPLLRAFGTTEMRSAFKRPSTSCNLVTDKDQFKHPVSLHAEDYQDGPLGPLQKDIEPLDTTHEGYELYLDPYLTTSRLHHRPFTADQLNRTSNSRDILTYYTYSDNPWVRSPKPNIEQWKMPLRKPKSMYDREKFKEECREIRMHNKLNWVPGSFRTETRDNYKDHTVLREVQKYNEEFIKSLQRKSINALKTDREHEDFLVKQFYTTEYSHVGRKKPLCSVISQHLEKNKKLSSRNK